jgi:hypothetical protein
MYFEKYGPAREFSRTDVSEALPNSPLKSTWLLPLRDISNRAVFGYPSERIALAASKKGVLEEARRTFPSKYTLYRPFPGL